MSKVKLNMIGGPFQHDICSSHGSIPKLVEWVKDKSANISIHIDDGIKIPVNKTKRNYAWVFECSSISPDIFQWVTKNISYIENNFELLFTHDKRILDLSDKSRLVSGAIKPWIKDFENHEKSKMVSMISSTKNITNDHKYRQKILNKYKGIIDCYGRGHNPINKKEDGLRDYYFSIAMENETYPYMFTEKITDCFATKTIPIYWGTSTIGDFFNDKGIIFLTDDFKIEDLSVELYNSKIEYIEENYQKAINIPISEDYIFESHINKL